MDGMEAQLCCGPQGKARMMTETGERRLRLKEECGLNHREWVKGDEMEGGSGRRMCGV